MTSDALGALLSEVRGLVMAELGAGLEPDDLTIVSGSITAGFGNETSDIDVYIVRGSSPPRFGGRQLFALERRIDVHDITRNDLRDLVEQAARYGAGDVESLTEGGATTLFRVGEGVPIIGTPLDARAREAMKGALAVAVERLARDRLEQTWRQFAIAAELSDLDARDLTATVLVEDILFALLAERGALYPNAKWNWEKLAHLDDADAIGGRLVQIDAALRRGSESGEDVRGRINAILEETPSALHVSTFAWRPVRPYDVTIIGQSDGWLVSDGAFVWEASEGICFVLDRCDGSHDVDAIVDAVRDVFGGAASRLSEDTRMALDHLLAHGLIGVGDADPTSKPRAFAVDPAERIFDVTLSAPIPVSTYVSRRASLWREWLEYLAFRDDFMGARGAAQTGAVCAAARGMIRQAVRLSLLTDGVQEPRVDDELRLFRAVVGSEHEQYRRVLDVFTRNPLAIRDLADYAESVELLGADLVGRPEIVLGGGLRNELEHAELFAILHELATLADSLGVPVLVEPELLEKAHALAGAPS